MTSRDASASKNQVVLCCVVLYCLVALSKYQSSERKPAYGVERAPCAFHNHSCFQNLLIWDSGEKVLKFFKEVGLAKSEKKLHPYFSEDPKCYISVSYTHLTLPTILRV